MEGLQPLHRRVAGIDVHRMLHMVTVLIELPDGSISKQSREFGGFKRDCRALADSEWLAVLARFGLVRASFIPPQDLRELRLVSRYRRKLTAMCTSELNRLHKVLDDAGIKLGAVVSDIHGVSARAMVKGLIEGRDVNTLLGLARGALKLKRDELALSLEGDLSARHLFVLKHIHAHIEALRAELADIGSCQASCRMKVSNQAACLAASGSLS
jgi:transposase